MIIYVGCSKETFTSNPQNARSQIVFVRPIEKTLRMYTKTALLQQFLQALVPARTSQIGDRMEHVEEVLQDKKQQKQSEA